MSEEELREKLAALDKAKLDSWSDEFLYTREELEANLKAKDEAKKASLTNEHAYTTEELEKNLKAKDEEKRSSLGIRSRTTSRDLKARTPQRRNFTRSGNRASLEIGEVQSFASLQNETPLAFAFALEIDDDGTDVNKSYLVPRTINKTCGLSSKKLFFSLFVFFRRGKIVSAVIAVSVQGQTAAVNFEQTVNRGRYRLIHFHKMRIMVGGDVGFGKINYVQRFFFKTVGIVLRFISFGNQSRRIFFAPLIILFHKLGFIIGTRLF